MAQEAEWDPALCTFVGPAKAGWELDLALERGCGWIIVESEHELTRVDEVAKARSTTARVALRINPLELPKGFGVSMAGRATPFGIDEENVASAIELATSLRHVSLEGFHIYAGTQCLVDESIAENLLNTARIFSHAIERLGASAELLIFGSGFGIPYHDKDQPIDLQAIAGETVATLTELRREGVSAEGAMSLELGRYLVGESGVFLSRVVNVKKTRGREILILDGGMNHHLAASGNLGAVIRRNYPIHNVSKSVTDVGPRSYDLSGPMCTNIDSLGRDAELPETEPGDIIGIGASGAYGVTASPVHFISHRPPREVLVSGEGVDIEISDVTSSGTLSSPPAWPASMGSSSP